MRTTSSLSHFPNIISQNNIFYKQHSKQITMKFLDFFFRKTNTTGIHAADQSAPKDNTESSAWSKASKSIMVTLAVNELPPTAEPPP